MLTPEIVPNEDVELNQSEFKEFYQNFGSSSFKLQGEIFEELGTKQLDIYFKSIGFASIVIGVIGVIAGFGFTAMDHVESRLLFFLGEGSLLGAIFYGLFWTQGIYQSEFLSLEKERSKCLTFYKGRNEKFMELYNSWLLNKTINKRTLAELNQLEQASIKLFESDAGQAIPVIYSKIVYSLMILGVIFLFGSFFIFDLLLFLLCYIF